MLAKAVAHHTSASFIRVVGSEFVQKYLGEGPRMVRDVFRFVSFLPLSTSRACSLICLVLLSLSLSLPVLPNVK